MKISLNWLKKFVKIDVPDDELVRLIGARLVEVEEVIDETHKYDNIYIVRVESAEHIPGTHLSLCKINVGDRRDLKKVEYDENGLVQVMCGAPNVRAGMLAVWIAPGAVVPASVHEDAPFVIGKRKMLSKYDSYGMLAGADELDFGDDYSGIVEIDPLTAAAGDTLAEVFELNDLILDIENKSLTHRPDCFGLIGFAREVAGILGEKFDEEILSKNAPLGLRSLGPSPRASAAHPRAAALRRPVEEQFLATPSIENKPRKSEDNFSRESGDDLVVGDFQPDFSRDASSRPSLRGSSLIRSPLVAGTLEKSDLKILTQDTNVCPRYTAIVLEKHGELKKRYLTWQDTILAKSGMRPIDPIVDATNYLMLLTGQPLHAFDYDKFVAVGKSDKPKIIVRLARAGEQLILLDGKEVELNEDDIVITSNDLPVALAGAMGGASTEIDENTRKVILEAATFSLYNLRKTQMAHGIFSEAITRFTKGQPAYQTLVVGLECAEMLSDGFKVAEVADEYPEPVGEIVVKVSLKEINGLLGTDYDYKLVEKTLANVGFEVNVDGDCISVKAPEWRTDIRIKEDIIEEVGRLLGYDNIAPNLPLHNTPERNAMWELKGKTGEVLRGLGANEALTYSFVSGKLMEKAGQDVKNAYEIVNSISPELQYVRQSIVPSLLDKAYMNQKIPFDKFALFEINKVYQKKWGMNDEGVPVERMDLGFVLAERKGVGTAYYKAKKFAETYLAENNIAVKFVPLKSKEAEALPFEPKRAAEIRTVDDDTLVGVVGEFKNSVRRSFKLAEYLAGFELNLDVVLAKKQARKVSNNFTIKDKQDITITTKKTYAEAYADLQKQYPAAVITPVGIYQPDGAEEKNITFHLVF